METLLTIHLHNVLIYRVDFQWTKGFQINLVKKNGHFAKVLFFLHVILSLIITQYICKM